MVDVVRAAVENDGVRPKVKKSRYLAFTRDANLWTAIHELAKRRFFCVRKTRNTGRK